MPLVNLFILCNIMYIIFSGKIWQLFSFFFVLFNLTVAQWLELLLQNMKILGVMHVCTFSSCLHGFYLETSTSSSFKEMLNRSAGQSKAPNTPTQWSDVWRSCREIGKKLLWCVLIRWKGSGVGGSWWAVLGQFQHGHEK